MTSPDDPDSAMLSGSDAGEPGEHLGTDDLSSDERRLLEELERGRPPREDDDIGDADDQVVRAAEDDAPLPGEGGDQGDGLSARFSSPPEGDAG